MINFLRRIRRDLINENKVSIYLIYAVGEVVLVVFGILIALQIDNWKEIQKTKKLEVVFLENLQTDLEVDISNFNIRIKESEGIMEKNYSFILGFNPVKTNNGFEVFY